MAPLALFTLFLSLSLPCLAARSKPGDAILLSTVQTLTLRGHGALTTHRRLPAVPQLRCLGPPALCALHDLDLMRCANQGSSYGPEDVEWSCTASLPQDLKLGSTDVICEGYQSRDDPYVLKGSCAVEYRLALTDVGEQRHPDLAARSSGGFFSDGRGGTDLSAYVFTVLFVAVLAWILWAACTAPGQGARRQPRRGGGGGGGGGGGWNPGWGPDHDDPPPPYPGSKPRSSQQQGWRPGFWSGAAGGAAAGYMAGNWGRNRDQGGRRGNGGGWGAGPSSSSSSSARHQSTGFGSTSRR